MLVLLACIALARAQNSTANSTDPCYTRTLSNTTTTLAIPFCTNSVFSATCANWCWVWTISAVAAFLSAARPTITPRTGDSCAISACTFATERTTYNYYYTGESFNCCSVGCTRQPTSISNCQLTLDADIFRYLLAQHNVYGAVSATTATSGGVVQSRSGSLSDSVQQHPLDIVDSTVGPLNASTLQLELSQLRPVILGYGDTPTTSTAGGVLRGGQFLICHGFDPATQRYLVNDACAPSTSGLSRTYEQLQTYANRSWTVSFYQLNYGGYCNPTPTSSAVASRFDRTKLSSALCLLLTFVLAQFA